MEKAAANLELILRYFNDFTAKQLEQFGALEELYKEWNSKINVISRKDIDGLYEKHVLHSLSIAAFTSFKTSANILDIGTGGGFPGIPLAIFFPEIQFHLVDSIGKKLKVVEAIAGTLGLNNITTKHIRVEEIKNSKFDYVVSRAVAPLKDLWEWSKPLFQFQSFKGDANNKLNIKAGPLPGGLICLKGGDLRNEIAESKTRPIITNIHNLFAQDYFKEKYVLYVPA